MRKEGWEPYPFKVKYLTSLIIYNILIFGAVGWDAYRGSSSIADMIGISIFLTIFSIQYIVGVRRVFADLVLKLKRYNFDPLIMWFFFTSITNIIIAIFFGDIKTLIILFIFKGIAALIYSLGIWTVYKDIKPISI